MADRVKPGPVNETAAVREAVSIHTKKIYDSCRDKDCLEEWGPSLCPVCWV